MTIAQTERDAIEAAAKASANKTGGDVEQIKRQLRARVTGEAEGVIRVLPINAGIGYHSTGGNNRYFKWNQSPRVLRHRVRSK